MSLLLGPIQTTATPAPPLTIVTFAELYGDRLDRELGSSDRTKLFTTARRQAAINEAVREFVKQTECLQRQGSIAIVDGTAEYDLDEKLDDFTWVTKQGVALQIVDAGGAVRVIGGDDLPLRSVEWLDRNMSGWRSWPSSSPTCCYEREDGGAIYRGLAPAPLVGSGDTWTLVVPYLAMPADMTADDDGPFIVDGNAKRALWPWQQAPVHYAAAQLEKLRKNTEGIQMQMQMFAGYVADYLQKHRPKGGTHVGFTRDYRRDARRGRGWGGVNVDRDFV